MYQATIRIKDAKDKVCAKMQYTSYPQYEYYSTDFVVGNLFKGCKVELKIGKQWHNSITYEELRGLCVGVIDDAVYSWLHRDGGGSKNNYYAKKLLPVF